ncbi:MAG: colanic acid biosynthesis glycosyltransferase WcaI, partial [Candidatus Electrothrix sp. LOE1_4_5]|nr:colanic acid biosynthesis glycosyltransferase WcaI [Candidatus Electrothrix gigas]
MKILVCGINYSPELVGIGKYTSEMVEWLAASGHECRVITAFPYYPMWFLFRGYSGLRYCKEEINRVTVYRCPLWIPKKLTTIKRIIHLLSFTISSCPVLCLQLFFWRPDLVICIAPSFLAAPSVVFFSKLAKVKSWLHFQDFEICAMFGTGMASNLKKIDNLAHTMQRVVTKRFDRISSISHTMCVSADRRCVNRKKVILFPNWVDTELITPNVDDIYFRKKWKISLTRKVILYSGNLGEKQGLENIINVASFLRQRHDILFVIVGDGACKKKLQQCATVKELINLRFYPLQPKRYLPSLLRMADIHLVIQKSGVSDKGPEITGGVDDLEALAIDRYGDEFARPDDTFSIGVVTFSRPTAAAGDVIIPVGTVVKTAADANGVSYRYETLVEAGMAGLTLDVSVQALEAGPGSNSDAGSINSIESALTDPSIVVTNAQATAGGEPEEDDTSYRVTIKNKIKQITGPTIPGLEAALEEVPGIDKATVIEAPKVVIEWDNATGTEIGESFT